MRISVKARPGAKTEEVRELESGILRVSVRALAKEGRANAAIEEVLAEYYGVPRANVRIVRGFASREKIVEIQK